METVALYLLAGAALTATALLTWYLSRAARGPRWAPTQRLVAAASAATKSLSRVRRSALASGAMPPVALAARQWPAGASVPTTPAQPAGARPVSLRNMVHRLRASRPNLAPARQPDPALPAVPRTAAGARPGPPGPANGERAGSAAASPKRRPGGEARPPQVVAAEFMQWLAGSLGRGETSVNTAHAPVHMSPDGLLLVYPAVFQSYLKASSAGGEAAPVAPEQEKALLKALCAPGWHQRGLLNSNLLHFHLQQAGRAPAFLRAVVIRAPQRFVQSLPPPNPGLVRLF